MTTELIIKQNETFSRVLRWGAAPYIYAPITVITQAAPVSITSTAHGIPNGWRVAPVSAKGMTQINAANTPPRGQDYHKATVVDANTIALNDINSSGFSAYTSGGYLQYLTPGDLAGASASMLIYDGQGGTLLKTLDTVVGGITLDNTAKTISLLISEADVALITWDTAIYELSVTSAGGVTTLLMSGSITLERNQ